MRRCLSRRCSISFSTVAIEDTAKTAQRYDADLWADVAEAAKRKHTQCKPNGQFAVIDENRRTRSRNTAIEVARASKAAADKGASKGYGKGASQSGQHLPTQGKWSHSRPTEPGGTSDGSDYRHGVHHTSAQKGQEKTLPWMRRR